MKKILFAKENQYYSNIVPASEAMPNWYRDAEKYPVKNTNKYIGFKSCSPFLDSLISGYMLTTQCDIIVEQTENGPFFSWKAEFAPINSRPPHTIDGMSIPNGYSNSAFSWWIDYAIQTPKGYSLLITHPLNRTDLPFLTTSGIVDSDSVLTKGHLPFFIREGFEGIIPLGTPYAQIIPIKRDNWKIFENTDLLEKSKERIFRVSQVISGYYKNNIWNKKRYN